MTIDENLRPRPVSVTMPTTMPAQAQVVAAFSAPIEPSASAFTSLVGTSAVSLRRKLSAKVTTMA